MKEKWYSYMVLTKREERFFLEAVENTMNRLRAANKPTGEDARVFSMEEARKAHCKSIAKKRTAIFFHVCSELGIDCHQVGPQ